MPNSCYPRNLLTDAFVRQFIELQLPEGNWPTRQTRPPMTGGDMQLAALAIRALREYPVRGQERGVDRAMRLATSWLREQKASRHEEHVYRLLGLAWAGEDAETWRDNADALLSSQLSDGGWAQFPGLPADAWGTGHALVALATAGAVQPRDPVYRRGVEFLLRTQFDDGSWFVQRRAVPFQAPFDSGFPFDRDQWISISGTAWAVMALVRAIEPASRAVVSTRSSVFLAIPDYAKAILDEKPERTARSEEGYETANYEEPEGESETSEPPKMPKILRREIRFEEDVAPILARSCVSCHSGNLPEGELDLTRRSNLLKGGESGAPAIVPGKSTEGRLLRAVASRRKALQMPPARDRDQYPALSKNEIAILRTWIEQGARWPENAQIPPPD